MAQEEITDEVEATTDAGSQGITGQSGGEVAQDPNAAFQDFLDSQNDPAELRNAIFQGNFTAEQKSKLLNKLNNLAGQQFETQADKLKSEHEKRLSLGETEEEKQRNLELLTKGNYEVVEEGLGYINRDTISSYYDMYGQLQSADTLVANSKKIDQVAKLNALDKAKELISKATVNKEELNSVIAILEMYADDPSVKPLLDNLENRRDILELEEMENLDYSNMQDQEAAIDADIVALRVLRKSFRDRNNSTYTTRIDSLIGELETKKEAFVKNKNSENRANF